MTNALIALCFAVAAFFALMALRIEHPGGLALSSALNLFWSALLLLNKLDDRRK